jgi:hypothetical protein
MDSFAVKIQHYSKPPYAPLIREPSMGTGEGLPLGPSRWPSVESDITNDSEDVFPEIKRKPLKKRWGEP